jgi:nicotinamide-nucleotide amidase
VSLADEVIGALRRAGATVATGESLTGGLVCATLVSVAGASDVVLGGVVAYAPEAKIELLDVDAELIEDRGTVDPDVAAQMAFGAQERFNATYGVSTTGVAGPGESEGKPAGTVHIAIAGPDGVRTTALQLEGDRHEVRNQTVDALLAELVARVREET